MSSANSAQKGFLLVGVWVDDVPKKILKNSKACAIAGLTQVGCEGIIDRHLKKTYEIIKAWDETKGNDFPQEDFFDDWKNKLLKIISSNGSAPRETEICVGVWISDSHVHDWREKTIKNISSSGADASAGSFDVSLKFDIGVEITKELAVNLGRVAGKFLQQQLFVVGTGKDHPKCWSPPKVNTEALNKEVTRPPKNLIGHFCPRNAELPFPASFFSAAEPQPYVSLLLSAPEPLTIEKWRKLTMWVVWCVLCSRERDWDNQVGATILWPSDRQKTKEITLIVAEDNLDTKKALCILQGLPFWNFTYRCSSVASGSNPDKIALTLKAWPDSIDKAEEPPPKANIIELKHAIECISAYLNGEKPQNVSGLYEEGEDVAAHFNGPSLPQSKDAQYAIAIQPFSGKPTSELVKEIGRLPAGCRVLVVVEGLHNEVRRKTAIGWQKQSTIYPHPDDLIQPLQGRCSSLELKEIQIVRDGEPYALRIFDLKTVGEVDLAQNGGN